MIVKDPNLPHQICLTFAPGGTSVPVVTCNCWKFNAKATAFNHHMGEAPDIPTAWRLYLDPANHRLKDFVPSPTLVAKYVS